jgi:hypothetical protein
MIFKGALESQFSIKYGKSYILSEQHLIDCDFLDDGCQGMRLSVLYSYLSFSFLLQEEIPTMHSISLKVLG